MRILFVTADEADYLSDSLLHGIRSILGDRVVDYPKADRLYGTYPLAARSRLYGRGFTLYGLLEDIPVDRTEIGQKIRSNFFDLVIFGSIWRNWSIYKGWTGFLHTGQTVLVDGEDGQNIFPYSRSYLQDKRRTLIPRGRNYLYFKRELTVRSLKSRWYFLFPQPLVKRLPFPKMLQPISFSIPQEKIVAAMPHKTKDFPVHIVDGEIARVLGVAQPRHPFGTEKEYYADLQCSRFGITTKRSGWDCMRHYEIAANGAVMCFRALDSKEQTCAPHGLDSNNCIAYSSCEDLMRKIDRLSPTRYEELRDGAMAWVRHNTTVHRAKSFLSSIAYERLLPVSLGISQHA